MGEELTQPAPDGPIGDQAAGDGEPKVSREDASRAWLLGVTAARTSGSPDDCPYEPRTPLAYHWLDGYMSSQR